MPDRGGEAARGDWLREALLLEDSIWEHARRTPSAELVWLDPGSQPAGPLARLGSHLYGGVTGVALFLAAAARLSGSLERRELILEALIPVRRQVVEIAGLDAASRPRLPLGGFSGVGAFVYAFLWMGCWLDEPDLFEDAVKAASLITPEQLAGSESLDVMHGCAGALLALLALEEVFPEAPLEQARLCGEHLLASRVSLDGQPRAWPGPGGSPVCGFAHGATGIAYALTRLYQRTNEERFLAAAREALAFERRYYSPEKGNWQLLGAPGTHFFTGWCNGAPGFALGRLEMSECLDDLEALAEARAALETTATSREVPRDFVCCGEMGKVEVLVQAYRILGEESYRVEAERIAARAVGRAREEGGGYRWFEPEEARFAPGFFRGASGVGYTLLRLARPTLPCVLSLDWRGLPC